MKTLKKLLSRRGMTLVEVMIATVIFSLITLAAASMYQPVNQVFNAVKGDSDMQRIVTAAESYITRQLRDASEIEIRWNGTAGADIADWDNIADAMYEFAKEKVGNTDVPQALIVRKDSSGILNIFNVRLNDVAGVTYPILPDPGSYKPLVANIANLEPYRVFNSSFYGDVELDFSLMLNDKPADQIRGNTFLSMQVDAYRNGDLRLNSKSMTQTMLTWIGNVGSGGDGKDYITTKRARILPEDETDVTKAIVKDILGNDIEVGGEFVVLYHNNIQVVGRECCDFSSVIPAKCKENGLKVWDSCTTYVKEDCPNNWENVVIPMFGDHVYIGWKDLEPPVPGWRKQICERGCDLPAQPIPECGPDCYLYWDVTKDPECGVEGEELNQCAQCLADGSGLYGTTRVIPALICIWEDDDCTKCIVCGGIGVNPNTTLTGHAFDAEDCAKCANGTCKGSYQSHVRLPDINCTICRDCKVTFPRNCCDCDDFKECPIALKNPSAHCIEHMPSCPGCGAATVCDICEGPNGCYKTECQHELWKADAPLDPSLPVQLAARFSNGDNNQDWERNILRSEIVNIDGNGKYSVTVNNTASGNTRVANLDLKAANFATGANAFDGDLGNSQLAPAAFRVPGVTITIDKVLANKVDITPAVDKRTHALISQGDRHGNVWNGRVNLKLWDSWDNNWRLLSNVNYGGDNYFAIMDGSTAQHISSFTIEFTISGLEGGSKLVKCDLDKYGYGTHEWGKVNCSTTVFECENCGVEREPWDNLGDCIPNPNIRVTDSTLANCVTPAIIKIPCIYNCGTIFTEDGNLGGHPEDSLSITEKRTLVGDCTDGELQELSCSLCGERDEKIIRNPADHDIEEKTTLYPNCTDAGKKIMECLKSDCKVSYKREDAIPALGHEDGEWVGSSSSLNECIQKCKRFEQCNHYFSSNIHETQWTNFTSGGSANHWRKCEFSDCNRVPQDEPHKFHKDYPNNEIENWIDNADNKTCSKKCIVASCSYVGETKEHIFDGEPCTKCGAVKNNYSIKYVNSANGTWGSNSFSMGALGNVTHTQDVQIGASFNVCTTSVANSTTPSGSNIAFNNWAWVRTDASGEVVLVGGRPQVIREFKSGESFTPINDMILVAQWVTYNQINPDGNTNFNSGNVIYFSSNNTNNRSYHYNSSFLLGSETPVTFGGTHQPTMANGNLTYKNLNIGGELSAGNHNNGNITIGSGSTTKNIRYNSGNGTDQVWTITVRDGAVVESISLLNGGTLALNARYGALFTTNKRTFGTLTELGISNSTGRTINSEIVYQVDGQIYHGRATDPTGGFTASKYEYSMQATSQNVTLSTAPDGCEWQVVNPHGGLTISGNTLTIAGNHAGVIELRLTVLCVHNWVEAPKTPANCTEAATVTKTCTSTCGAEKVESSGTALGHTADVWTPFKPATCSEKGSQFWNCKVGCGHVEWGEIAVLPHTYGGWGVDFDGVKGYETANCIQICTKTECKHQNKRNHTWGSWVSQPLTHARTCNQTTCTDSHTPSYAAYIKVNDTNHTRKCLEPNCTLEETPQPHTRPANGAANGWKDVDGKCVAECTANGCNHTYTEEHDYTDDTPCTRCGKSKGTIEWELVRANNNHNRWHTQHGNAADQCNLIEFSPRIVNNTGSDVTNPSIVITLPNGGTWYRTDNNNNNGLEILNAAAQNSTFTLRYAGTLAANAATTSTLRIFILYCENNSICVPQGGFVMNAATTLSTHNNWARVDNNQCRRSCSVCTNQFQENHTWGAWASDADKCGTRACTKQGCTATETQNAHNWSGWQSQNDTQCGTRSCSRCNYATINQNHHSSWNNWVNENNGQCRRVCNNCNRSSQSNHTWSSWSNDADKCGTRSCTRICGAVETYSNHSFGSWNSQNDTQCGTRNCSRCNLTTANQNHTNWDTWVNQGNGQCKKICGNCNREQTQSHVMSSWIGADDEKCGTSYCGRNGCDYTVVSSSHSLGNWTKVSDYIHAQTCSTCLVRIDKTHTRKAEDCNDCNDCTLTALGRVCTMDVPCGLDIHINGQDCDYEPSTAPNLPVQLGVRTSGNDNSNTWADYRSSVDINGNGSYTVTVDIPNNNKSIANIHLVAANFGDYDQNLGSSATAPSAYTNMEITVGKVLVNAIDVTPNNYKHGLTRQGVRFTGTWNNRLYHPLWDSWNEAGQVLTNINQANSGDKGNNNFLRLNSMPNITSITVEFTVSNVVGGGVNDHVMGNVDGLCRRNCTVVGCSFYQVEHMEGDWQEKVGDSTKQVKLCTRCTVQLDERDKPAAPTATVAIVGSNVGTGIQITNNGSTPINSWSVTVNSSGGGWQNIYNNNDWGGNNSGLTISFSNNVLTVSNNAGNFVIQPGQTYTFGIQSDRNWSNPQVTVLG